MKLFKMSYSVYIDELTAMQLYTSYLMEYIRPGKVIQNDFNTCFQSLFKNFGTGYEVSVEIEKFMEILENLSENLQFLMPSVELKKISMEYTGNQYYKYIHVKVLVQPFIDRLDALAAVGENVIVSVKFCKTHFIVETVYKNILKNLLG